MILVRVWMLDGSIREYAYRDNEYDIAQHVYVMFDKLYRKQVLSGSVTERTIDRVELTLP
jgi:hypothetical protein